MAEFTPPQRAGIGEVQYRVPKVAVEVGVMLDLLLSEEPFMPITAEGGEARLIHKRRIVLIRFASLYDADLSPEETEGALEVPVRVELCGVPADRATIDGRLLIVMPPGHCRIIDMLNVARPFFPLLADGEVSLVGRKNVVSVAPL